MKERERDIQASIIEFLTFKGIFHYRNNSGGAMGKGNHFIRFGTPGSPDVICVVRGRYVGIEVKRHGGKLRESQEVFRAALEAAGGLYWIFTSLDEAVDTIEEYVGK